MRQGSYLDNEENDGPGDEPVLVDASVAGGGCTLQDCVAGSIG